MYRTESIPSGIRLQQLIQNQHAEILDREKDNSRFIHLYNIGTYWVAFEQSACLLNEAFPHCDFSLFMVPDCSDYVVMASVASDQAEDYLQRHLICHDELDYKVLAVSPLSLGNFREWHVHVVKAVL